MRPFLSLLRVLSRDAGLAAARTGAPFYFGLAAVVLVIFVPAQGMRAADAVQAMADVPALRLGLFAGWIVATTPTARALFATPSTWYLRALPAPRWWFWVVTGAQLLLVEAPWIALHARGAGALAGAAAALSAMAAHSALIAGEVLLAAVIVGALLAPTWALTAVAAVGVVIALPLAWRRAPERGTRVRGARVAGPPPLALARAYLAVARRAAPTAFGRALLVTAAGAAFTALIARNDEVTRPASLAALSAGLGAASLTVALGGIAEAVHAAERAARWLLSSTATTGAARVTGAAMAIAACGAVLGALHGVAVVAVGGVSGPWLRLGLGGAAWGAVLGALASSSERLAEKGGERSSGNAFALGLCVIIGAAVGAGSVGAWVIPVGALLALGALAATTTRAAAILDPPPEPGAQAAS